MEYSSEQIEMFFDRLRTLYKEKESTCERALENFFTPLLLQYQVAKEVEKEIDRFLASRFNLVDIMDPDENKISDVIALLLRPDGTHAQGNVFLRSFLLRLEGVLPPNMKENIGTIRTALENSECTVTVQREALADGFLDILITFR